MSSTGRGANRARNDYYRTDSAPVRTFLREWFRLEPKAIEAVRNGWILDPCAGGNIKPFRWDTGSKGRLRYVDMPVQGMTYPEVIRKHFADNGWGEPRIDTQDIREDSPAAFKGDFLTTNEFPSREYSLVITNPSFSLAFETVKRGLEVVAPGGYVVMLLRLNWLETAKRFKWLRGNSPERIFVHHARPSFRPDGRTDSTAYMHAVWRKGHHGFSGLLRVI
jgi:hypothetical protein